MRSIHDHLSTTENTEWFIMYLHTNILIYYSTRIFLIFLEINETEAPDDSTNY